MRAVPIFLFALSSVGLLACVARDQSAEPQGSAEAAPSSDEGGGSPPGRMGGGVRQATAAGVRPLDKTKFGQPITESTTTPLPAIVKDPSGFSNKTVRTEGMVSAVCQSMGCWMQIADTSGKAHIKMAGHSFFVPKESSGHRAVVQGKVMSGPQGAACGNDQCGNQEMTQVEIEATGVEFID
ncbi:MAG: DUF4920 domain-containing protein [Polyangiaceae bacterium]